MSSCDNFIYGNNVTECGLGIEVSYSSNNNTIYRNSFSMNSKAGVAIGYRIPESGPDYGGVANNYFIENNVTNNKVGIYLIYSKNNTILHNNIQGNNASIIVDGSYVNIWDDGSKGNYWSDYNGTDANHDGIGDTPYIIDANNTDLYPLIVPNAIIPEFPSIRPAMFLMLLTLLAVLACKKRALSNEACEKKGS
jgi:parallel beta-helix repeat protein